MINDTETLRSLVEAANTITEATKGVSNRPQIIVAIGAALAARQGHAEALAAAEAKYQATLDAIFAENRAATQAAAAESSAAKLKANRAADAAEHAAKAAADDKRIVATAAARKVLDAAKDKYDAAVKNLPQ